MDLIENYKHLASGYVYVTHLGCEEVHYGRSDMFYFAHRLTFLIEEKELGIIRTLGASKTKPFIINDVESNHGYVIKGQDALSISIGSEDGWASVTMMLSYVQKLYLK